MRGRFPMQKSMILIRKLTALGRALVSGHAVFKWGEELMEL
jgi:hypothetical protein